MADITELTTPLTKAEVEAFIYATLNALGVTTTSWKPGATVRTMIAGASIVLAGFSSLQARIAESGFLELSSGDWLDLVGVFVYDVERDDGTFATGNVQLDNAAGGLFNVAVGDLVVLNTTSSKTYRNTAAFTLNPLETGLLVPVRAEEIGSASTANPGQIDDFVTVLLDVTVTNPDALVGSDPESDADYIERCLAKTGVLSPNGPSDAYRFLALSATRDDGATVDVTRVTTVADGEGNVTVTVGSATGSGDRVDRRHQYRPWCSRRGHPDAGGTAGRDCTRAERDCAFDRDHLRGLGEEHDRTHSDRGPEQHQYRAHELPGYLADRRLREGRAERIRFRGRPRRCDFRGSRLRLPS